MIETVEYAALWLLFMALIAAVALAVPHLAKVFDRMRSKSGRNASQDGAESGEQDGNQDK